MEAVVPCETSVNIYETTWRHIPEENNVYGHGCEGLHSLFV
jgi:hypothetical protein